VEYFKKNKDEFMENSSKQSIVISKKYNYFFCCSPINNNRYMLMEFKNKKDGYFLSFWFITRKIMG